MTLSKVFFFLIISSPQDAQERLRGLTQTNPTHDVTLAV